MSGTLEAIDRILNRGGDPDEVLRAVVGALHVRAGVDWAGIAFVEESGLALGPTAGGEEPADPERRPISFRGKVVAELQTAAGGDAAVLDRVAVLVSPYCLVAWDTGGEVWNP